MAIGIPEIANNPRKKLWLRKGVSTRDTDLGTTDYRRLSHVGISKIMVINVNRRRK